MAIEVMPAVESEGFAAGGGGGCIALVAVAEGESVGRVRLRWRGGYEEGRTRAAPHLEDLFVVPEWRSRGIGSRLVAEAEELARACGARRITLGVERANLRARALYERLGYLEVGAADDHVAGSYIGEDGRPHRWRGEVLWLAKELA